jgi:hypothetical protein
MPERAYEDVPFDEMDDHIRAIAREEVASLSALVLRRLQEQGPTRSPDRNMAVEVMNEVFGEALRDFGSTKSEPGPE